VKTLILTLIASSSLAHAYTCRVDLVRPNGAVAQTFYGNDYYNNNTCRDGLRECNRYKRQNNINGTCESFSHSGGGNYPNPQPPQTYMTDYELAQEAYMGRLGRCRVADGGYNSACRYYVKIQNYGQAQGFPFGTTGCSDSRYTQMYGCYNYDDFTNAGCLLRQAYNQGQCF
jgi:hypothetical protein